MGCVIVLLLKITFAAFFLIPIFHIMCNSIRNIPVLLIILSLFIGCEKDNEVSSQQWIYFDTVVELKIFGEPSNAKLDSIFAFTRGEFTFWDSLLAPYSDKSAIYIINSSPVGTLVINRSVGELLRKSFEFRELTEYALEPKLGHLIDLWAISSDSQHIPTEAEIDSVMKLVDESRISFIDDTTVIVEGAVKLNLSAFAKGFAVDKLYEKILPLCTGDSLINGLLIDAGRNIRGWHRERDFVIGIANPRGESIIETFELKSGLACASAGDYERFFIEKGIRYHHIFDPKTGFPAGKAVAATVIGDNALTCDAISTAAIVLGENLKKNIDIEKYSVIIFIGTDGKIEKKTIGKNILK